MEEKNKKIEKLVPDTSVIIEGILYDKLKKKELIIEKLIIPEAVMAELEHMANEGRSSGFVGLKELEKIRNLNIEIEFIGDRPKTNEIRYAHLGEIDNLIRKIAYENDATLITADKVQAKVGKSKGIPVIYIIPKDKLLKLKIEKYFDETTMSVHLKENVLPTAKKGKPGDWKFVELSSKKIKHEEIKEIADQIVEEANKRKDSFIEIERLGSTIVQLGLFRIVITKPPFADGWEITAVKPVKQLNLEDYNISEKLLERLEKQAEGILVAGSPGMGKSTWASALARFYANKNKIVKTVEAPRDLVLPDNITQYAISHGNNNEIHDILLLSRPDYTIFDEMRNISDFKLFSDLRLAGVGLVGVVHATNPVDAIQRFIGKIELGIIPQVVDTVIFIKNGEINKVLSLEMTVKVPHGMTEADLSRPVVIIKNFETNETEFEIYTYGEETVVIPINISKKQNNPLHRLAEETIYNYMKQFSKNVIVKILSDNKCEVYVPENKIGNIIGKQGKKIDSIEKELGLNIDIKSLKELNKQEHGKEIDYSFDINKNNIIIYLPLSLSDKEIEIYIDDDFLIKAKSSKKGIIKITKKNKLGKILADALKNNKKVKLYI